VVGVTTIPVLSNKRNFLFDMSVAQLSILSVSVVGCRMVGSVESGRIGYRVESVVSENHPQKKRGPQH